MKPERSILKINPLADRVVIEPLDADKAQNGSIIIPETAKEKPQKGRIIAVGPGKTTDSGVTLTPQLSVDDIVLYSKYGGSELSIDGQDYLIMREGDVVHFRFNV